MRKYNSVLVVRFSSLGDVVLVGPVFSRLRELFPGSRITLLTKKKFKPVHEYNPCVDRVMCLEEFSSLIGLIRYLRGQHIDLMVDLHGNVRSRIVGFFSGIHEVVRYRKDFLSRRLLVWFRIGSQEPVRHTV
ncbi:MAG: hypothetical protein GF384_08930, partial [Elusimicrobia bacterium]|nr:hypothetical protein [Elusimicrobiota bacterium]MBD3412719.1 hypothetical protein [Elusimicrobiota bacterium]